MSGPLVEMRGLRVYAYHGVRDFERERGQTFVIDVWLACAPSPAEASDDLADAVNYSAVCDRVAELATGGPYDLLERLAAVIADDLPGRLPGRRVRVRVAKPHAPVKHDVAEVAVTVERWLSGRRANRPYNGIMDGMRIVVVEDQPLFRRGLIDLLDAEGFRVDGSAGTVREAIEVVAARMPDIVLMDLQLADGSGIDATRRLYELYGERVRVVMLSESRDPADMIAAVRAGAVGYLTKDQAPERLAEALRGVLRGEAALSRRMAAHLIADVRDTQRRMVLATKLPHRERLTPRQLEILQLIAAGETTTEIAQRLFLSPETVRWHVKAILRKLKARTRAEAAACLREVMV